ncbi:acyltransferase [Gordonia neofelifaecis]|uniref:Acyltransferase 3 n=1 Tax=Gordonia neofelifaecis NRRL B-59395 TaxID=644548 RepID=F1YPG8_9ACTN|nr:acyltransferase [Gordonia neofelifaecis]EGD53419.1 acyltransferase 3 [Gordonia neofelifaecis NRRL B-59395]
MVNAQPKIDDDAPERLPSGSGEAATPADVETPPADTASTAATTADSDGPVVEKKKKDGHLYQIDFVRLFTFGGVILDHVILGLAPAAAMAAQGVGLLLRYTRYCFFALTGFVLTYQYRNRDLHAPTFWRRRYKLIGLPFLMWSLFYWTNRHYQQGGWEAIRDIFTDGTTERLALKSLVYDLITGNAAYHLYFLSVSMQIYLVFPAVLWVLKRTWGYHRYLLAASLTFHIWLLFHMVRPPLSFFESGVPGLIWRYLGVTLFPYQFFILAGCLAAYHYEAFGAFMRRFRRPLVLLALVTIIVTLVYFVYNVDHGEEMFRATNVFMVHNSFAFVAIIVILYILGTVWQDRRRSGSVADNFMRTAADRSFGIYLAHVIVLSTVLETSRAHLDAPLWLNILLTYVVTVLGTVYLVEVLRRSPISLITTGRERIDWRIQRWGRSSFVAVLGCGLGFAIYETVNTQLGVLVTGTSALLLLSAVVVGVKQSNAAHDAKPVRA